MNNGQETKTLVLNGQAVTFRRRTHGDRCKLAAILHKRNMAKAGEGLKAVYLASGIEEGKLPIVVAELMREPSYTETRRWMFTDEGIRQAAAIMAGVTPEVVDTWPEDTSLDVGEVVYWGGNPQPQKEDDGKFPLSNPSGVETMT